MADLNRWDYEFSEMVLEYLYGLEKSVLIDKIVKDMKDYEVEALIDQIEEENLGWA